MDEARFVQVADTKLGFKYCFEMPDITVSKEQIVSYNDVIQWCRERFGEEAHDRWSYVFPLVFLRRSDDAFEFKLRWV